MASRSTQTIARFKPPSCDSRSLLTSWLPEKHKSSLTSNPSCAFLILTLFFLILCSFFHSPFLSAEQEAMEKERNHRKKILEAIKKIPGVISGCHHTRDEDVVEELESLMSQVEEFVTDRFEELSTEEFLTYSELCTEMQKVTEFLEEKINDRKNFKDKNKEEEMNMEEEKLKHEDAVELLTNKMLELNIFNDKAEERKEIDSPESFAAKGIGKKRLFWVTRTLEKSAIAIKEGIEKNESRRKRLKLETVQQMDLEETTVFKKMLETDQQMPSLESDTEASSDDHQDSDFSDTDPE